MAPPSIRLLSADGPQGASVTANSAALVRYTLRAIRGIVPCTPTQLQEGVHHKVDLFSTFLGALLTREIRYADTRPHHVLRRT